MGWGDDEIGPSDKPGHNPGCRSDALTLMLGVAIIVRLALRLVRGRR